MRAWTCFANSVDVMAADHVLSRQVRQELLCPPRVRNRSCLPFAVSSESSSYAQVPGGPGRWTLNTSATGLDSMAHMYSTVSLLADDMTLYTTLQGITMQLLIIRLIRILSAQKRLSILTSTAIKVGLWHHIGSLSRLYDWFWSDAVYVGDMTKETQCICWYLPSMWFNLHGNQATDSYVLIAWQQGLLCQHCQAAKVCQ